MKTIILPTDFSDNAHNAFIYAINLFGDRAKYVLFHSFYVTFKKSTMFVSIEDTLRKEAEEDLKKDLKFIQKAFPDKNLNLEIKVTGGELTEELNIYDKRKGIDFIVMGTKGASGIKEVLIGSNSAHVFDRVKCPVITVPEKAIFTNLKSIVFAADYEHISNNCLLDPLLSLADDHHAKIMVVHASEEIENSQEEAERLNILELFLDIQTTFHGVDGTQVDEAINDFAVSNDADLLVMLARGGSFLHKLLHPSITKKVSFHSKIPVMVLHNGK